jgi:serine/threonine-protein kinase
MLGGRYRVVALVGRGGMGEVYRADDLKLGQAVALKFLPASVERDLARLQRFLNEVKIARQISHPNVCRVYDVGEVDGHHYLSMEYVDGEDLASLLRRIGRLPKDKAVQISRQLCMGLAAAHEEGILHRDLKPANVMIDGRGRARITDFGLATLAGKMRADEVGGGTPLYMAPEQRAGKELTVRSDLYSLGLVLYELFTGQRAFAAATPGETARLQEASTPTSPSRHVEGFDRTIERVILRCLEKEPGDRPSSALAVAAALPGGDLLAAAVAAGETPSPELVAEAGAAGGLTPTAAWTCLAALALGVGAVVWMAGKTQLTHLVPLEKPPEVLLDRAREVIRRLGYQDPPADTDFGFDLDEDYLAQIARSEPSSDRWSRLSSVPPFAIGFWYRQSPRFLVPYSDVAMRPSFEDPPPLVSGMVGLRLDPAGRLQQLEAVPPERDVAQGPAAEPDWNLLLSEAGFESANLKRVEPVWSPTTYADKRGAWGGVYPQTPGVHLRIEAAVYRGRPVSFRIIEPWSRPDRMEIVAPGALERFGQALIWALLTASMVGGALIARRNVRLGRVDRKGAFSLAVFMFGTGTLGWLLRAHHVMGSDEIWRLIIRLSYMLFMASTVWVFYLALEPVLRRIWPEMIVSWVRLLDGRFRDPLVGRDVLLGLLAGVVVSLVSHIMVIGPGWMGLPSIPPGAAGPPFELPILEGVRSSAGLLCLVLRDSLSIPIVVMILLLLCRIIFRKRWAAIGVVLVLLSLWRPFYTGNPSVDFGMGLLIASLSLVLLFRIGLLTVVVTQLASILLTRTPLTFDVGSWYMGNTLPEIIVLAALALYGFRISLAGRRALSDAIVPET